MSKEDYEIGMMYWMAVRYALPRHSMACVEVLDFTKMFKDRFSKQVKEGVSDEIKEHLKEHGPNETAFNKVDHDIWREILLELS